MSVITKYLTVVLSFNILSLPAQVVTWSDDIAPIIYDNCASCHHTGGIAPFNLMNYEDVLGVSSLLHEVVEHRTMPPWPADPAYRHFVGETVLTQQEIDLIHTWVDTGLMLGNLNDAPAPPEFLPSGSLLDRIDYTVAIAPYTLQTNRDEYRWFVIPTNFNETKYISKLEVVAGLETVVHHADLFLDLTGNSKALDDADPLPGFNGSTGYPTNSYYINAWQPGAGPAVYPENWGIEIPPGADLVVEIHFGPGGVGQVDSTIMNLQFLETPTSPRPVKAGWLLADTAPVLIDGPLVIPANEVVTFHQVSNPLPKDLSLISICPHMHFLGKSYEVWAETPDGEIIPLINIPHWDFHWQKYYTFQQVQKIPQGSVLKSVGVYDNTLNNHDNPNNPPMTVSKGLATTDEMFLCYFIYADYENGDEHIVLDPNLITTPLVEIETTMGVDVFPNPTNDILYLAIDKSDFNHFEIYDINGRLVSKGLNSTTINVQRLQKGLYYIKLKTPQKDIIYMASFVKM